MEENRKPRYDTKTVSIRRVAKVTAGGKRLRFSAIVVCGDRKGSVGVGLGRGVDTKSAVEKGARAAEKNMKKIELIGDTIPHQMLMKFGAAKMILRPARPGTGIIGIENVYAKLLGSPNLIANTFCTFEALKALRNDRVLKNMNKMQERIGLKEAMDEERKKKEAIRRKNKKDDKKPYRHDNRRNRNDIKREDKINKK